MCEYLDWIFRQYLICGIWIQIHSESGLGFTGKSNSLDSWVLWEVTSLLFVYVCDADVTSGFAGESTSKLDSRIRIRIRALNGRIHWIWKIWIWVRIRISQIEYGLEEPVLRNSPQLSWSFFTAAASLELMSEVLWWLLVVACVINVVLLCTLLSQK